jgi:hypothetical protein
MEIIDKRTSIATREFGELPIGTVFEFPSGSEGAEFRACIKIETADTEDNTFDLEGSVMFTTYPDEKVCVLNAHLVIEGR